MVDQFLIASTIEAAQDYLEVIAGIASSPLPLT